MCHNKLPLKKAQFNPTYTSPEALKDKAAFCGEKGERKIPSSVKAPSRMDASPSAMLN